MLKLHQLYEDILRLAERMHTDRGDRVVRREAAMASLHAHAGHPDDWRRRADEAETNLHLGGILGPPDEVVDAPAPPAEHCVVATDGSQIYPDLHAAATFFVVNIGRIVLSYGADANAVLDARPKLYGQEEEIYRGELGQRQAITADEVSIVRTVDELEALVTLAGERLGTRALVALVDGKLVPWSWLDKTNAFQLRMLDRYLELMAAFESLGVPVASYLSRSGANEVINLVRIADCDQPRVRCKVCPHVAALTADRSGQRSLTPDEARALPCGAPAGLYDTELFAPMLTIGQRSAVFRQRSPAEDRWAYEGAFFYLKAAADEVARIEIPYWVAADPAALELVHAVLADQVAKGRGYPVALREAHEQAIVRGPDRAAFQQVLERAMVQRGTRVARSRKGISKDQPGA